MEGIQVNAMTDNVVPFTLPKKPKVKEEPLAPDQRKIAVIPIRACTDPLLTHGMLKSLILICSYMNRSGITWVGQKTMADRLGISQQAISKHLVKLTKAGYLEILKKPMPGARHTTWRVIFDASISAEDAVSITSAIEDTRPPYMKEQQAMQAEQADKEGQARVAQAISKVLKQPKQRYTIMPKQGETITVKNMKAAIKKAQAKGSQAQPPEVVQQDSKQAQPEPVDNLFKIQLFDVYGTTSKGCREHKEQGLSSCAVDNFKKEEADMSVLNNQEIAQLVSDGMTAQQVKDALEILLPLYRAEGITPSSHVLMAGIRQLVADTR
jgi:DNA-binding transcriptional regulator GbsR (MarR family)